MQHTFDTPDTVTLYVELSAGDIQVDARDTTETTVTIRGRDADEVKVSQDGDQISVIGPRRKTGIFGGHGIDVEVVLPAGSTLLTKTGSTDLAVTGTLGECKVKSGSGDVRLSQVTGDTQIEIGSGDIDLDDIGGELRIKSGSGDVQAQTVSGSALISTGSGDVTLRRAESATTVKTGSGDLHVDLALSDVELSTASGDLSVGRFTQGSLVAKNVSGDVRVGIPAGIPVWTDVSSMTGRVGSDLQGAGQPTEGQPHIEVRAKTISGDVMLEQL